MVLEPTGLAGEREGKYPKNIAMQIEPSDILFLVIVLWLAVMIMDGGPGGGKRAPVPAY